MRVDCKKCKWCWKFISGRGYGPDQVGCDCKQRIDAKEHDFITSPLRCNFYEEKKK